MLRTGGIGGDEGQVDLCGGHAGQLDLSLLSGLLESLHGHLVAGQVDAVGLAELLADPVDDSHIEVIAAETVVTGCRKNLLHAVAHFDDGDVEGAAAKVVNHDLLIGFLVDAVGKSCGGRLVDDSLDVETRDLAGVLGRLTL